MPPEPTLPAAAPAAPVDPTAPPVTPGADSAPRTIDDTAGIEDPNDRSVAAMLDEVESRLDEIERNLADLLVQSMTDVPVDREDIVLSETGDSTRPGRLTPQDPSAHRINQNGTVVAPSVTAAVNPARTGGFDEQGIWHDVRGRFARKGWSGAKAAMLRSLFDASADVLDGAHRATPTRLRLKDEGLAERLGAVDRIIEATYADGEHAIVTDGRGRRVRVPWNEFDPDFAPVDVTPGDMNDLPDPPDVPWEAAGPQQITPEVGDRVYVVRDGRATRAVYEGIVDFHGQDRVRLVNPNGSFDLYPPESTEFYGSEADAIDAAGRSAFASAIDFDRTPKADGGGWRSYVVETRQAKVAADISRQEQIAQFGIAAEGGIPAIRARTPEEALSKAGANAREWPTGRVRLWGDTGAPVTLPVIVDGNPVDPETGRQVRGPGPRPTLDMVPARPAKRTLTFEPPAKDAVKFGRKRYGATEWEAGTGMGHDRYFGALRQNPDGTYVSGNGEPAKTRYDAAVNDMRNQWAIRNPDPQAAYDAEQADIAADRQARLDDLTARWEEADAAHRDALARLTGSDTTGSDTTGSDFNDAPDRPVTDDDLGPDDPTLHGTRHINHGTRDMGSWNVTEARPVQGIPAYEGSYRLRDNSGRTVYATTDEIHDTADAAKTARTAARRPRRTKAELDAAAYRAAGDMGAVALFTGVNPRSGRPLKDDPFTTPTTPTPAPTPALDPFDGWDIEADLADTEQQLADLPPNDTTFRPSLEAHATFLRTKLTERNNTTPNTPNNPQTTNRDTPTTTSPTPPTYNDLPAPPRMPEMARTYSGDEIRSFTLITNGGIDSPAAAMVADGIPVIDVAWEPNGPDRVRAVRTPGVVTGDGAFLSTGASESLDIPVSVGDPEWLAEGFGRTVAGHGAAVRVRRVGESGGRVVGVPEFNDMADRPLPPPNKNGLYPTVEQVDAEHVRWTTEPDPDFPEDTWSSTSIVGQFVGDGGDGNAHAFNRTRVSVTGWEGRYSWEVDAANPEYDDTEQWIGDYRAKVDPFAWSDPVDAPSWYEEGWAPTLEQAQADALAAANRMPAATIFRPLDTTHHEGLMDEVLADAQRRRPRPLYQGFAERLSGQPARRTEWDTRPAAEFNDRGESPAWPEARQYVDDLLAARTSDLAALTDDQLQATYRRIRADRLAIYPAAVDAARAVADRAGSEADYQATTERRDRLNRLVSELDAEVARRGLSVREATDGSPVLAPADAPGPFPTPTFDIPTTTTATETPSEVTVEHIDPLGYVKGRTGVTILNGQGADDPTPHGVVLVRGTVSVPFFDATSVRDALERADNNPTTKLPNGKSLASPAYGGQATPRDKYQGTVWFSRRNSVGTKAIVLDEATAARWKAAHDGVLADMAAAKARKAEATAARKAARAARQDSLPDGNDVVDMAPAERLAKSADDSAWLVAKDNYLSRIGVEKGQAVRVRRIGGDPVIDVLDGGTTRTQQVKLDRFADTAPAGVPRVEMPEARGNGAVAAKAAAAATTAARVQAAGDAGAPVEVADNYLSRYGAPQGSVVTVAYHDDRNAVLNVDGRQVKAGWARFTRRIPVPDGEGGWDLTEPADPGTADADFNDLPDRPGDDPTYATMLRQIGGMTLMAISGGRRAAITNDADETIGVRLPVAAGYRVDIVLDRASDTYTVTRVFSRGGKDFPKGTLGNVYADQLADIAYAASNYMDPFGAPEVNDLPDRPDQLSLLDLAPTEVRAITNAHSTFSDAGWYATDAIGGYRSPDGAVTIVRLNGGWKATDTRTTPFVGGATIDTTTPERVVEWADQRSAALAANPVDTTRLVNDDRLAVYAADPNIRIVPAPDMLDTRKGRYGIIAETPDRSTREVIGQFRSPADAAGALNDLRRRVAALAQDPDATSKLEAGAAKAPTFARPATVKASAARPGDWATDIQGVTGLPADGARIASVPTMDDGNIRLELAVSTGRGTAQARYETVSPLAAVSIYRPINDQPVDRPTYTESVSPTALAAMGPDRRAAVAEAAARVAADTAVGTDRHAEAARVVAAPPARETVDGKDTSATFIALDATGVPPASGTAAIPEGAVRLYHYPSGSSVDYVLDTGLPAPDGDRVVWAQTRPPVGDVVPFVEFWTNPNNIAAGDAYGNGHVALAGQVPTGNIVSYSTPTIAALRTFRGSPALWTTDRLRSALGRYRAGSPEAAAIRARLAELGVDLDAPAAEFNDFRPFEMVRSALTRTPDAEYLISLAGTGVPNGDGRVLTADEIRALSPSELRSLDRAMSSWLAQHPYGDESGTDLLNTLTIDRAAPDPVPDPVVEPETPRRRRTAYSANGGTLGFIPMSPLDAPADFPVAAAVGEPVVPGQRRYFTADEARQAFHDAYGPDADPDEVMAQIVAEQDAAFEAPAIVAAVLTQSQHDQRVAASRAAAERRRQRSLSKATNRAAQSGRQVDMSLPGSTTQPGNSYPHRPAGAAAATTPAADPQAAGRFFSALNKAFDDGANVEDVPAAQFDELVTGLASSGYGTEYLADGHMKVTDTKSGRSFTMRRRLV